MRHLDLFSGVGGFALGLLWAGGFETIGFCEQDEFCQRVLAKHWPGVPCHDDIRTLQGDEFGPVDIVTGGPPCQGFSLAGQRRGVADDRHLWPEMLRIIQTARPTWVIFENVAGLQSMELARGESEVVSRSDLRGADGDDYQSISVRQDDMLLASICDELVAAGYDVAPLNIPACGVGAPHRRERVWIVARADRAGHQQDARSIQQLYGRKSRNIQPSGDGESNGPMEHASSIGRREGQPEPSLRRGRPAAAEPGVLGNAASPRQPHGQGIGADAGEPRVGTLDRAGWDDSVWLACGNGQTRRVKPDVRLLAHGLPQRVARLKALGNAVVPQIVERIGRAITEAEG